MLFQLHSLKISCIIVKLILHSLQFTERFKKKNLSQSWKKQKLVTCHHCLSIGTNACFMKANYAYYKKYQGFSETYSRFEII